MMKDAFLRRGLLLGATALVTLIAARSNALAQSDSGPGPSPHFDGWRTTILEENDSLYFNSDKHYTQGFRVSFLSPPLQPGGWTDDIFDFLGHIPTVFTSEASSQRRIAGLLGQSIFTPKNLAIKPPDPHDEPYAGWLYTGPSLLQDSGDQLENFEIDLGVIGPPALGRQIQNDWHQLIGVHQAQGWSDQLQNEPGAVISYERFWRVPAPLIHWTSGGVENGVDIVPEIGGSAGNVFDYTEAGAQLRIGRHLEVDYGPAKVRPSLSGTDYFDGAHLGDEIGFYFYAGAQGRAVAHDIFLDGNNFRRSPHVEHKTLVGDLQGGFSVFWSDRIRLDVSAVRRSIDFVGQRAPDVNGTAAISFSW